MKSSATSPAAAPSTPAPTQDPIDPTLARDQAAATLADEVETYLRGAS